MKLVLHTLTLIFLFVVLSCSKKSDKAPVLEVRLASESLKYIQIQPGKYFIYKDSASGKLDSVVVTTSKLETIFTPPKNSGTLSATPAFNSQKYSITLSKIEGGISSDWLKASTVDDPGFWYQSTNEAIVKMVDANGFKTFVHTCSCNPFVQESSSFTVEGKTYPDVVVVQSSAGQIFSPTPEAIYYWAKSIGIIKKQILNPAAIKTFNLIRNN